MMPRSRTPAGSAEPAFTSNAQVLSGRKSSQTPASFPTNRGQSTRVGRPRLRLTPTSAIPLHTSGTVACIGVSSYLLHSTHLIGVQLLAHARSTLRQIHELRIEQAIGEAWHDGVHFLRCEAQRESKLTRQGRYDTNAQQCHAQLQLTSPPQSLGGTPRSHCAATAVPQVEQARLAR